jgi:hypothetical protein
MTSSSTWTPGWVGWRRFAHLDQLEIELREFLGPPVRVVTAGHESAFARRVRQDADRAAPHNQPVEDR